MDYSYYSYRRKSTGREFFVTARTLIAVKLLRVFDPPRLAPYLKLLRRLCPRPPHPNTLGKLRLAWVLSLWCHTGEFVN
jgi:hypothetical protein